MGVRLRAMTGHARVHGLDIAYERHGQGPPLVLLHGALSDSRFWRRQLEGLAGEFTVMAWDEPGAGHSSDPPADFTLADFADCLAELIETLDLAPAHVAGLSWGGVVAQELYERAPRCVASLILADTYAGWRGSLSDEECDARLAAAGQLETLPRDEFAKAYLPGVLADDAPAHLVEELDSMMRDFHPASVRIVCAPDRRLRHPGSSPADRRAHAADLGRAGRALTAARRGGVSRRHPKLAARGHTGRGPLQQHGAARALQRGRARVLPRASAKPRSALQPEPSPWPPRPRGPSAALR